MILPPGPKSASPKNSGKTGTGVINWRIWRLHDEVQNGGDDDDDDGDNDDNDDDDDDDDNGDDGEKIHDLTPGGMKRVSEWERVRERARAREKREERECWRKNGRLTIAHN